MDLSLEYSAAEPLLKSEAARRLYANGRYHIYAIVAEMPDDNFVVKFGMSGDPWFRYDQLGTGIPFKSIMLYARSGTQKRAYRLENKLHKRFAARRTTGEWFLFHLSEKEEFHGGCKETYYSEIKRPLEWERITLTQARTMVHGRGPVNFNGRPRKG